MGMAADTAEFAIDAEDLELWFEKSSCVALQFAQFIGKFPIEAKPLKRHYIIASLIKMEKKGFLLTKNLSIPSL